MYEQIRYEVEDPMALITLSRPEALNAWTGTMAEELRDAVERAEQDPAVVAIVITGAGAGFCAGADMKVEGLARGPGGRGRPPHRRPDARRERDDLRLRPATSGHLHLPLATTKPIIAAINGAVAGMAVPLVLCCDLRFMSTDAVILTAFAQRGLIAEFGLSWLLPRLVGPASPSTSPLVPQGGRRGGRAESGS